MKYKNIKENEEVQALISNLENLHRFYKTMFIHFTCVLYSDTWKNIKNIRKESVWTFLICLI